MLKSAYPTQDICPARFIEQERHMTYGERHRTGFMMFMLLVSKLQKSGKVNFVITV